MEESQVVLLFSKKDFKKICRCCLSLSPLGSVFEIMYEGTPLVNILHNLFGTQLDPNDNSPKKICETCIGEVLRSYKFKKSYEASEATLLDVIEIEADEVDLEIKSEPLECDLNETQQNGDNITATPFMEDENIVTDSKEDEACDDVGEILHGHFVTQHKQPRTFTCVCMETFASKLEYRQHRELTGHHLPRNYSCEICGKPFTKRGLQQHSKIHDPIKQYSCSFCQMKFSTATTLRRHTMRHTGERRHLCEFCGKAFIQMEYLRVHRRIHTGERPYLCSLCGKSFRDKMSCDVHMRNHNKQKLVSNLTRKKTPKDPTKAFVCETCGRQCYSLGAFKLHLYRHGLGKDRPIVGEEHQCKICKKFYSSSLSLSFHMKIHSEKRFLCSECGKGFHLKSLLESHALCHTGEKSLACEFCDKKFARPSSLQMHLYVHTGEKPYACNVCPKKFRQSTHLTAHLRVHTGERPYVCRFCNKAFPHKHNLNAHIRRHTGEKPYKCDVCATMFFSSSSLRKHRQRKHQQQV